MPFGLYPRSLDSRASCEGLFCKPGLHLCQPQRPESSICICTICATTAYQIFDIFDMLGTMSTFRHLAPASVEAHASDAQSAALTPASSNGQWCHLSNTVWKIWRINILSNAAETWSQVFLSPRVLATDWAAPERVSPKSDIQSPLTWRYKI